MPKRNRKLIYLYDADEKRLAKVVKRKNSAARKAGERETNASEVIRELISQEAATMGIK